MKAEQEIIRQNITSCKDIKKILNKMSKSKLKRPDIFLLLDELKTKVDWLKSLYGQHIPK